LASTTISLERLIVSGAVNLIRRCHKLLTVGGNVDRPSTCVFST